MKVMCPNNPNHKEFYATAHVVQEWKVDEEGNFLEVANDCLAVASQPDKDSTWTCAICGAEAEIIED